MSVVFSKRATQHLATAFATALGARSRQLGPASAARTTQPPSLPFAEIYMFQFSTCWFLRGLVSLLDICSFCFFPRTEQQLEDHSPQDVKGDVPEAVILQPSLSAEASRPQSGLHIWLQTFAFSVSARHMADLEKLFCEAGGFWMYPFRSPVQWHPSKPVWIG